MDAQNKQPNKPEETSVEALVSAEENKELGIKRIRTYAEDLALAKEKAGVKDETPTKKKGGFFGKKEKKPEPIPTKKDLSKIQPEVTMPAAPPKDEETVEQVRASKEYIQQELAKSGIVTEDSIEKKEAEKEKTSVSQIRTLKYDAAESIEERGTSKISMLAAEQKRRVQNKDFSKTFEGEQSAGMNIALVAISIVLVVGGIWGGIHFYNKSKIVGDEPVVVVSKNLLFTDNKIEVDAGGIKGSEFRSFIQESKEGVNGRKDELSEITLQDRGIFGESKISKDDLFKKIEGTVPARLVRNLNDSYIVGVHSGEVESVFYLFKIDDFDTVFAGVLEWENSMRRDLYADALGTSFEDIYIRNKDTRTQKDNFGNIKLIYSFPNSDTLLITETEEAFFEVFERLTVSNATQN